MEHRSVRSTMMTVLAMALWLGPFDWTACPSIEGPIARAAGGRMPTGAHAKTGAPNVSKDVVISGRIVDAKTHKPVTRATIYYGSCGTSRTTTDRRGNYRIAVPRGDVYLGVFAPGYKRHSVRMKTKRDQHGRQYQMTHKYRVTVGLVPDGHKVRRVHLRGTLTNIVRMRGTRSEYAYIVLKHGNRKTVLFDVTGCSATHVLTKNIGRLVQIDGLVTHGFVGWMHRSTPGVLVTSIHRAKPTRRHK